MRKRTKAPASRWPTPAELVVARLGRCPHPSPIPAAENLFVDDTNRILLGSDLRAVQPFLEAGRVPPSFEPAGARARVFFEPAKLSCGIVTCGGLCPGLNNVIRAIVLQLTYVYRVRHILGFRYGYAGLAAKSRFEPTLLTPDLVGNLHRLGGTFLGSSRGPQDLGEMAETLVRRKVGILFVIGGDGGLRGASALAGEIRRRKLPIAVIGVPKTIDNDLEWTARTFGFATAVEAAAPAISAAHAEAQAAWNGIGLVKLMGRESGFIAAGATLASADVNFCLVPEVPFTLSGKGGFLEVLERRMEQKHHAVIVVAEGAGQDLFPDDDARERDASGNVRLKDIGIFLRDEIARHFAERGTTVNVRYIDPSYTIRSQPANSLDAQLCLAFGQHAAHAGMAGRTDVLVGIWNQHFTHVPIPLAIRERKRIDPAGEVWERVLETTRQPASMLGRH